MFVPSLRTIAAQVYADFLVSGEESTALTPVPSVPSPETHPSSLSSERVSICKGDVLQKKILDLRVRLLPEEERATYSISEESLILPTLAEDILDALEGVLVVEELPIKHVKTSLSLKHVKISPSVVFTQKAHILFYFLNTRSEERKCLFAFFEQDQKKGVNSIFRSNIEFLLSYLFLDPSFNEKLSLWKVALSLTEGASSISSEERKRSRVEEMIETYVQHALRLALKKDPFLLTSDLVNALKIQYPHFKEWLGNIKKDFIFQVLSMGSSGAAISAFKKEYPDLSAVGMDQYRCRILGVLASNNSAEAIEAFKKAYPEFTVVGLARLVLLRNLARNNSAEAIAVFKKEYPDLSAVGFNGSQRSIILQDLASNNSAEGIVAFKTVYPELSAADLFVWNRFNVLNILASNNSAEAIMAFQKVYPELSAVGLDEGGYRSVILNTLASNNSEAIEAFKEIYPEIR